MDRALKEAAVQRQHYGSHEAFRGPVALVLDANTCVRRLKTLVPCTFICR